MAVDPDPVEIVSESYCMILFPGKRMREISEPACKLDIHGCDSKQRMLPRFSPIRTKFVDSESVDRVIKAQRLWNGPHCSLQDRLSSLTQRNHSDRGFESVEPVSIIAQTTSHIISELSRLRSMF